MASSLHILFLLSLTRLLSSISSLQTPKHYVVYMGSSQGDTSILHEADEHTGETAYLKMLASVIPREERERVKLVHCYKHAFNGFSAMLTDDEAAVFSGHEEVVSVFPDPVLELHTTRSWDFLESISRIPSSSPIYNIHGPSDVIIGVVDTGIWPESPSFNDKGIGEIPSRWKGACMEGPDFKKSHCNRKLIGARYYPSTGANSPRDSMGHGTHTASTAAGARVPNASYRGLARGTAMGGHPVARIAVYKACSEKGCPGSALMKAIDDAVNDGVDLISVSIGLGGGGFAVDYLNDPIAVAAFHAELRGIPVICSAGNDGPEASTVSNTAPWLFTVAASNIDREFQASVVLGTGKVLRGTSINFSNLTRSDKYPLVYGRSVARAYVPKAEARSCNPGSLDRKKVAGKIVVCVGTNINSTKVSKMKEVDGAGGRGVILINEKEKVSASESGVFPFSEVDMAEGYKILKYISETKNSKATILPTVDVLRMKPAPVVAYFSSRGPAVLTENILKPDVMAPGVTILAALPPSKIAGVKPTQFGLRSGTSMACPHVSGAAAFIKSLHPSWTPSMIKSALMTTAIPYDNRRRPVTNTTGLTSTLHETGAGEISPHSAADPGLVFETTLQDYIRFLCYSGYSQKAIKSLAKTKVTCPNKASEDLISNINYPSISIGKLRRGQRNRRMIERTVTNVGPKANVTYVAEIEAPGGLVVRVSPKKLVFQENTKKLSFRVWFHGEEKASKRYHYGSLVWSDGHHLVRSVFSVQIE